MLIKLAFCGIFFKLFFHIAYNGGPTIVGNFLYNACTTATAGLSYFYLDLWCFTNVFLVFIIHFKQYFVLI